jgi:hypothetical protein
MGPPRPSQSDRTRKSRTSRAVRGIASSGLAFSAASSSRRGSMNAAASTPHSAEHQAAMQLELEDEVRRPVSRNGIHGPIKTALRETFVEPSD